MEAEKQKEAQRVREEAKVKYATNFDDIAGPGVHATYPSIQSPVREILGQVPTCQNNFRCRDLELNLMDCLDGYGRKAMLKECKDLFDDYKECLFSKKQMARVQLMQKERLRQFMAGERSKANLYSKSPELDGYERTYKKTILG